MTDLVFLQDHAPHGSIRGQEVLDACLMGSAFASCTLIFLSDGVYQLVRQATESLGVKDYSVSYGVLGDYGVEKILCLDVDLATRGLSASEFVIDVEVVDHESIREVLAQAKQVLTF